MYKEKYLTIRATESEKQTIKINAIKLNMTMSQYIIFLCTNINLSKVLDNIKIYE